MLSVGIYRFRLSAFRTPHSALRIQGLLDSGADRQSVGAHFHAFLGLLAGLGRVLTLNEGLLDATGWLARRNGLAALEWPRAGAAARQQGERKPDTEEGGQPLDSSRASVRPTLDVRLWTLDSAHRSWDFRLQTRDFRLRGLQTLEFGLWTLDPAGRALDFPHDSRRRLVSKAAGRN